MSDDFPGYPATPAQRHMVPAGIARQARNASRGPLDTGQYFGDTRSEMDSFLESPELRDFTSVPAIYTIQATIGPEEGDTITATTQLRPEPFVLQRITWATSGDLALPDFQGLFPFWPWSQTGRAIEVRWGDSFTTFLGTNAALLSALFGDSSGFLDLPTVALFQGSQNLQVTLTRLLWPMAVGPLPDERVNNPRNIRVDICFHGVGLLPKGVNQSGSVG